MRFVSRDAAEWRCDDPRVIPAVDALSWATFALALVTFGLVVVAILQFREAARQRRVSEAGLTVARESLAAQHRPILVESVLDPRDPQRYNLGPFGDDRPVARGEVRAQAHPETANGLCTIEVLNVGKGPAVLRSTRVVAVGSAGAVGEWPGRDERLTVPVDRPERLIFILEPLPEWFADAVNRRSALWVEVRFTDVDGQYEQRRYFELLPRHGQEAWHIGEIRSDMPESLRGPLL